MKIIDFSIRRKVTVAMFTLAVILFGIVSLSRLKVNLLPDLSYPTLTIRTEYEGAAPAEIENLITKPIEEAVGVVKGVSQVKSISRSGQSDVTLEFAWGTDMNLANLEVISKLDAIQLPLDADKPVTLRFDPTLDPIMRYALYFDENAELEGEGDMNADFASFQETLNDIDDPDAIEKLKTLRVFADEQLKKNLESSDGVASVKISGGLEEEIQVNIDQQRLAYLNIPIETVTSMLASENVNLSGGRLEEGTQRYLVRTLNQFQTIGEISNIIITRQGENAIYLKDVANIDQAYKEREAITRLDGKEAVEIAIYKEGDANTVAVADGMNERMNMISESLPAGMRIEKVYDQSVFIASAVSEVRNAGIIGGLLAVLVLYLFLRNFWATVIISISIPVSIIATFNLMYGNDISLNIMSLGGIALGIGMLVDNSIVVLENIARYREMGKSSLEAAKLGAGEVGTAVIASTLTTIAVFFPLVFVEGIAGQLFQDQALTVTFALLASLVVAITLIPMLSSIIEDKKSELLPLDLPEPKNWFGRMTRAIRIFLFYTIPVAVVKSVKFITAIISKIFGFLFYLPIKAFEKGYEVTEKAYLVLLKGALTQRALVLLIAVALFAGSLQLGKGLGVELIPSLSQGEFNVEFKLPPGSPIEQTDKVLKTVQAAATDLDGVTTTFAVAGTGNRLDANPEQGAENSGELSVVLNPGSSRADEEVSMDQIRGTLQTIPGLEYKFSRPSLFTFRTPVEIEINGYDLEKLKQVSDEITKEMNRSGRFVDVKNSLELGSPEIQIIFDRERASAYGLQVYEVADRIVSNVRGDLATKYTYKDRKIDVLVRAREEDRNSIDQIRQIVVNPNAERPIPLDAIADIQVKNGPSEIRRISQQRVAMITANLNYGDLGSAADEIQGIIRNTSMPTGVYARIGGQNEEMSDSFRSLMFALGLAVFLVYLVMASQFESLLHPFIILFTIPLALIGAIFALWVTNSTVSVVVFIGLILLAGIVVNNAIVLIDLINQLRERGMDKMEAIIEGGKSRLRPILMTTLTTTLGLLPLAIGFGDGAELRAPMGITVIGGLLVSTLLTLVVIPVMYSIMDRKKFEAGAEGLETVIAE